MNNQDAADVLKLALYVNHLQAEIDALMLEFCPERMTQEQVDEWMRNQVSAEKE